MSGILGVIAPLGRSISVGCERVVAMRDRMTARGPDDAGLLMRGNVALAHRRLAIRDPSAETQPIVSEDGQTVLVYNGELYNDRELRTELQKYGVKFQTRCDTETLLAAWSTWGVDCLQKLKGMFAFGVYDFAENRLFLVRDRFGVKPLFFAEVAGELVFSSTVAAVLEHPHIVRQPNWSTISHYLTTFRTTMGRETMFRGVSQLRPAEYLDWNLHTGQLQIASYWDFPTKTIADITSDEAANELESLIVDATKSRLVSDVPVGMFLSGGVDSSILASYVSESHDSRLLGSCGGGEIESDHAEPDNDFSAAAHCARHTGFDFDEVRVSSETYLDCWSEMVHETALPLTAPSDVIIHQLARRMKQDVGVVLGIEGADELLCGYALPHWSIEDFRLARLCATGQWPGQPSSERAFLKSLEATYGRCQFDSLVDHYFAANSLIPLAVKPQLLNEDAWNATGHDEVMVSFYQNEFATDSESRLKDDSSLIHSQSVVLHRLNLKVYWDGSTPRPCRLHWKLEFRTQIIGWLSSRLVCRCTSASMSILLKQRLTSLPPNWNAAGRCVRSGCFGRLLLGRCRQSWLNDVKRVSLRRLQDGYPGRGKRGLRAGFFTVHSGIRPFVVRRWQSLQAT
ncbi:MAG: asparagine synthase (glutamine-hydrolyzing) [Planctomycetaceae bacterium]|nr:asparagine synthase (glutamine-hydrolyzing) [Planctomycetaceae bacterium]